MAKRNTTRRRRKIQVPVAVVAGFIPLMAKAAGDFQAGGFKGLQNTVPALIGYSPANKKFTTAYLHQGLIPIVIGFVIHKLAGALGVNRALAGAGVPFVRV